MFRRNLLMLVIISIIVVVVASFSLTSCKTSATTTEEDTTIAEEPEPEDKTVEPEGEVTEPANVVFWWWGEEEAPGLEDWLMESVDMFEATNPDITIETVEQTADGLYEAFGAAAAAQEGPDLQYLWGGMFAMEQVFLDNFAPLSDYISAEALDSLFTKQDQMFNGKVWSLPWYTLAPIFVYNKEIVTEAGLDPENQPTDWDDFIAALEAIRDNTDYIPLVMGNSEQWQGEWVACALADQNADSTAELMEVFVDVDKDYADPKYSEWWYKFAELRDKELINEDANTLSFYQGFDSFKNGEAGFVEIVSVSLYDFVSSMGEDVVGILPIEPIYGTGDLKEGMPVHAQTVSITSWSEYKEEAGKFIDFLLTEERLNAMYLASGAIPPSSRFDLSLLRTDQEKELFESMSKSPLPYYSGKTPGYFTENALYRIGTDLLNGDSVESVIAKCQNIIDEFRLKQPDVLEDYTAWYEGYK